MQGYNLIVIYNETTDKVLLCKRRKNPYKGLYNFVGGKIEPNEDSLIAAYRELQEETTLTKADIVLTHFMDLKYYTFDMYLEVYVGKMNKTCEVMGDENDLYWSSLDSNFFDTNVFAGEGNMGHILMEIDFQKEKVLK